MDTSQYNKDLLSAREFEILQLLAHGCKNREIGFALDIEESTVRFHVGRILNKLGVKNRVQAVYHACRNGWLRD